VPELKLSEFLLWVPHLDDISTSKILDELNSIKTIKKLGIWGDNFGQKTASSLQNFPNIESLFLCIFLNNVM